jgi:UDP-glucose 4-epimerase
VCLGAATGRTEGVAIFGTDYDTPDGTCIRDYVDVEDLASAHHAVLTALRPGDVRVYNVGTGRGHSVREVIDVCRAITGVDFPERESPRRPGDPPVLQADPSLIAKEIGWRAAHTDIAEIIESAWGWWKRR